MLTPVDAPRMHALSRKGARFDAHHSIFPCTTLTNAGAIATGSYPQKSSWWGEKLYAPTASGTNAKGATVDFKQHIDVRDWATLKALDDAYNGQLATAPTLFKTAKAAGLRTAILGKPGATFLQDMDFPTFFIDTDLAAPLAFARELQGRGYALPPSTHVAFPDEEKFKPQDSYVNPYAPVPPRLLDDGITADPAERDSRPSQTEAYAYFVKQYVEFILPEKQPDLSFLWFNEPDASLHTYGPASPQYRAAIRAVDTWVGQIVDKVAELGLASTTDIIVTSDHGGVTVSGDPAHFPLRPIKNGRVQDRPADPADIDPKNLWSVSGQAMLVEPLRRAGFNAFNGRTCIYDPLMTGMKADGSAVYAAKVDPAKCGADRFTSSGFPLPTGNLPTDAVLIMETAGGDFIHVPSHDATLVAALVRFLQERAEVGAIFVNDVYGDLPGVLKMSAVFLNNNNVRSRAPDIALSYWSDDNEQIFGVKGIGYHNKPSPRGMRGDHGALDKRNVDIIGFALGPDFREGFANDVPTANVDIAPTIAHLLGLADDSFVDTADGRVLFEVLKSGGHTKGRQRTDYTVTETVVEPASVATGLSLRLPTSPDGLDRDPSRTSYTMELRVSDVLVSGRPYRYLDAASAIRK